MSRIAVCEECGSNEVQELMWVEVNTDKVISTGCGERKDRWCPKCEEHTEIKYIRVKNIVKSTTK